MVEDLGKIITNGFETYTKNLNLSIPYILNIFITGLIGLVMFVIGFFFIFGSSLSSLRNIESPEAAIPIILSIITANLIEIVAIVLIFLLVILLLEAFFTAGAIGMIRQATETGRSEISTMMQVGKKNVVNLFLAQILVGLLSLAGIVFMVPGAMEVDFDQLFSTQNTAAVFLLIGGFLLWMVYLMILSLLLAVFPYALVVDNYNPVDGIIAGLGFFNKHKLDVFLMWIFIIVIAIVFAIIGQIMGLIPVINIAWAFIDIFISIFILPPIITTWWVRLYMTRTDKPVYINELLAHPNDLK